MDSTTLILPAHIEETVSAIARLQADHAERATPIQRLVEKIAAFVGRPQFLLIITIGVFSWIGINLGLLSLGTAPFDPRPYNWLQALLAVLALYVTVLILVTQRYEDRLAGHCEQLTLELAILDEQKSAKIIELLEEQR